MVMLTETFAPFTVTVPDDVLSPQPEIGPTLYEYVPFTSVNTMVDPVELIVTPFMVTDQESPDGRPVSVNVTV